MAEQSFKERFFDEKGLPEFCYLMDRVNNVSIIVKRGETGFYAMDYDLTADGCRHKNEALGIDECQAEAMSMGSMWGWEVPGADPQQWYDCRDKEGKDVVQIVYGEG